MLYIPKIDDCLKILTDEEVKDFIAINFSKYFKSTRKKLYSKLSEEQNLRKVVKFLYVFLTTSNEVEEYVKKSQSNSSDYCVHYYNIEFLNIFDLELRMTKNKPINKNKLKELLSELKKFKVQAILALEYK